MLTPETGRPLDVAIVGGGIVGLAAAYKLLLARPGSSVVVLEKETGVGRHQSGHNSGVLHAGLSYEPGSAKARLAVDGIRQMAKFCRQHGVPHEFCGKLVVARAQQEIPRLRELMDRGLRNGLRGLSWVDGPRIGEFEPYAGGVAALWVPEEGIVDFPAVCHALVREITRLGGQLRTGVAVRSLRRTDGYWTVGHGAGELQAQTLVNCAGLHSDRVARLAGSTVGLRIVPFRGRYWTLRPERAHLVRHLVYPVPDPGLPFLGVHFTRRINGTVDVGPNAMLAFAREGYRGWTVSPRDLVEAASFPGLWRFVKRHPRLCWREVRLTMSRTRFARAAQELIPRLRRDDLLPAGAGVRAQGMWPDGRLVTDFVFDISASAVHLLNAPSPGATASLAIGDEIVTRVLSLLPQDGGVGQALASAAPAVR